MGIDDTRRCLCITERNANVMESPTQVRTGNKTSGDSFGCAAGLTLHRDEQIIPTLAAGETAGVAYETGEEPLLAAVRPGQALELSYKNRGFGGRFPGIADEHKGLTEVSCFRGLVEPVKLDHLAILGIPPVQSLAGRHTG